MVISALLQDGRMYGPIHPLDEKWSCLALIETGNERGNALCLMAFGSFGSFYESIGKAVELRCPFYTRCHSCSMGTDETGIFHWALLIISFPALFSLISGSPNSLPWFLVLGETVSWWDMIVLVTMTIVMQLQFAKLPKQNSLAVKSDYCCFCNCNFS